ncbi:hypothetical protein B0T21DRAFT_351641 [Apiosordaria backusii]|uniref:Alpha-ketoglutarate-dependent dioxygenase AlkB-like domain-containing protein n=1 Tax=Apiosordaria backusii TaxID=314023 RepID=A0AA40AN95_9PEZI|nr:hypothetical protein B0T21DRAFT_351641 [Apiosordaria backusii]
MSAMATETVGTMPEEVFSACSSPLSSPPSSPLIPPLSQDEATQNHDSQESIAGPMTPTVSLPAPSRPKRQAAVRAAEKITSIIDEFGTHNRHTKPRGTKRGRDASPDLKKLNSTTEIHTKRIRTQDLPVTQLSPDESDAAVDAEFDNDKEPAYTADTGLTLLDAQINTANTQPASDLQGVLVNNILMNLRAKAATNSVAIEQADVDLPPTVATVADETSAPIARAAPRAPPPIRSKFRGGMCEALPYFKAYKGSCYFAGLVAKGFLIDIEVEKGDMFGENGGGRVKEGTSMVRSKDAVDDAINVRSLTNAYAGDSLIAIVAGDQHPLYPCQPPAVYSVLDWFHITYMWKEKLRARGSQRVFTVWRVRFEKANPFTPSWWIPLGEEENVTPVTCPVGACSTCNTQSKQIFTVGWFCLNHLCRNYYKLPSTLDDVDIDTLAYSQEFLNERTPYEGDIPSLIPTLPNAEGMHGTELALRQGFVCPKCNYACRRVYWSWLACESSNCRFRQQAVMIPYSKLLLSNEEEIFTKNMQAKRLRNKVNDSLATILNQTYAVLSPVTTLGGYTVRQFFLTNPTHQVIGSFTIFRSSEQINTKADGPDELFRTLEVEDIGLRRNPAAIAGHKLEGLTRHFQQNFGARYKFGVSVQSKGFADAPPAILKALKRLDWAKGVAVSSATANFPISRHGLGDNFFEDLAAQDQNFNELLALGYMEEDRINYHDDGEKELGPVVAALSLGSPCTMRFRPKRNKGFETDETPKDSQKHKKNDRDEEDKKEKKNHKDILEVEMRHGDMMVMAGTEIQRFYEHAVTPQGKRRFALTARFVDPAKMELQSDIDDALIKGAIPPHAANFTYDGY